MSEEPANAAHDCADHAGHRRLERRSPDIIEIHEGSEPIAVRSPRTRHKVLPVGTTGQLVQEQIEANKNEELKYEKGAERNAQACDDARDQPARVPNGSERSKRPHEEHWPIEPK